MRVCDPGEHFTGRVIDLNADAMTGFTTTVQLVAVTLPRPTPESFGWVAPDSVTVIDGQLVIEMHSTGSGDFWAYARLVKGTAVVVVRASDDLVRVR